MSILAPFLALLLATLVLALLLWGCGVVAW